MTDAGAVARILNVNDSPGNRYYVTRVLRAAGWDVLEAARGSEALDLARAEKPHAIVLDIKLPDMSGLDVCRHLRADPATADIIIIQTSATFVTSEGKARGLESGADQYLTQPFEAIELVAMVKNLLALRQKEWEAREKATALVDADRRKDEFLAMLAHELRNPLAAISTAADLLDGGAQDDGERVKRLAATISRQSRHLARLVDDLLDVSRVTRGKIQLRPQPTDLSTLVRRFVESDAGAIRRGLDIQLSITDDALWIDGDVTRIEQILSNLIGNAVKYSERGGRISISLAPVLRTGRRFAELKVRDAGIGIAHADIASIFDLFFQVDSSLARTQSGLGIGLTMVKSLVEMHGGRVTVSSGGIGRGAEFTVELPTIEPAAEAPEAVRSQTARRALRLLLVDDNVDACELQGMFFEEQGHEVTSANDGETGLGFAVEGDFDVAVIDIGLPTIDGYEVARRIRASSDGAGPALIALTGYGRAEDKKRALASGFDAHVVKPVDILELHRLVGELAARRSAGGDEERSA